MAENSSTKRKLQNYSKSRVESEPKRLHQTTTDAPKQEATSNINHLPNEILEMIFSNLAYQERIRNELVCRRWHWLQRNCQQVLIVKIVRFHFDDRAISSLLSRCGRKLRELEIINVHDEKPKLSPVAFKLLVQAIVNHCPKLKELKLVHLPLGDISLKRLSVICTTLKVACLHNLREGIEDGLSEFLMQCKDLVVLDIEGNIGQTCFAGISKKLQILRLTRSHFNCSVIESVWRRCDKLTELSLTECANYGLLTDILGKFFEKYKDTLRILRQDRLCLVSAIPWTGWQILRNLEVLSLDMARDVTDALLNLLTENCIAIENLCVSNTCVSDTGLNYLRAAACLKVLDISRNTRITDIGINLLHHLPALEKLNVGFLPNVSLESFVNLANSCSKLNLLDVRGNYQVSNEVVHVLDSRLRMGDLNGNFTLLVWYTDVTNDVETCGMLKMDFCRTTPFCEKPLRVEKNVWYL